MNYDQLTDILATGHMDWVGGSIYGLLFDDLVFDSTQSRLSELTRPLRREPIQGRYITDDGNLAGNAVAFYTVVPDTEYQVVVCWDDGKHDDLLLGFFDTTQAGDPLQVQRRGSMIIRPLAEDVDLVPHYGLWLVP